MSTEPTPMQASTSNNTEDNRSRIFINKRTSSDSVPMALFDKSPSSMDDVTPDGDPTPPTETMDDLIARRNATLNRMDVESSIQEIEENRTRRYEEDEDDFTTCNWLEYVVVVVIVSCLLLSVMIGFVFWTLYFGHGYGWMENPEKQFNLHPVLMVTGLVTISGFSMLLYRISRCCGHLVSRLFHALVHILTIPCVTLGFFAVYESKMLLSQPHFYSLHSWMGFVTVGMFVLQFVFGFFTFMVLLCCEGATAACREAFKPIHASFGITIFMLSIATALTGLTEKAAKVYKEHSNHWSDELITINALAMVLVALAIVVVYIINRRSLHVNRGSILTERL